LEGTFKIPQLQGKEQALGQETLQVQVTAHKPQAKVLVLEVDLDK